MVRVISILLLVSLSQWAVSQAEPDTETEETNKFWESWEKVVEVFKGVMERDTYDDRDPWESWNRKVFAFNDTADRWVLSPVAKGYQWVTPDPVEKGIRNAFSNLLDINVIVNDLLQFKLRQAASDSGRFLVNTTIGIGGLFDIATQMGLEKHNEDFGQTLGKWGVTSGPYVVVPLLGSYTLRSGVGAVGNSQLDPVRHISHIRTRNTIMGTRFVDQRAALFAAESLITGDRYTFIRDAYLQRRDFLTNDGVADDSFGDEDFEDFDDWDSDELAEDGSAE